MKVQITVNDEVWRNAKSEAALRGDTLGEFVSKALFAELSKPGRDIKPISARIKQPKEASRVKEVVSGGYGGESAPEPKSELKEGYGWCLACKVKQVKLPNILCERCK